MSVYTEEVNLKDGISGPAKSASNELNALTKALTSAQAKLTVASATGNIKAFKAAQADVTSLKTAISQLPPEMNQAAEASGGLNASLTEMTGGLNLVVEAAAAVAMAVGAVVIAGAAMAIKANEANREMTSMFDALGEGKVQGTEVVDMLSDLSSQIGITRDQLAPFTKGFMTLGVTGTEQLKSLTVAAAGLDVITKGAGEAFTSLWGKANAAAEAGAKFAMPFNKLQTSLKKAGLNIGDLATAMGMSEQAVTQGLKNGTIDAKKFASALQDAATSKGAGPLAKAGASLSNVWGMFMQNVNDMFKSAGPAVDDFLASVKDLFSIFDAKATSSGDALKQGVGGFFKQVFVQATKLVPLVKHFLLDLIIYGLRAYIALKPMIASVKEFLSSAQGLQAQSAIWSALKGAIIAVAVVLGAVVAALGVMAAATVAVGVFIWSSIEAFVEWIATLASWATSAATYAKDFIAGLVGGIRSGAGAVVDAVKGLADSAKNAFKNALGIHSPSKEMMKLGAFAGEGVAMGLDSKADQVGSSSSGMAGAAKDGASSGLASGGGSGGAGGTTVNVTVEAGAIVIGGGGGQGAGQSAAELTETAVSLIFERIALSAGL